MIADKFANHEITAHDLKVLHTSDRNFHSFSVFEANRLLNHHSCKTTLLQHK